MESIIRGNFNQFNESIFKDEKSRGRQCTANAVTFLAFTLIVENDWTSSDIDNILIIGNYICISKNHNRFGKFFQVFNVRWNIPFLSALRCSMVWLHLYFRKVFRSVLMPHTFSMANKGPNLNSDLQW